MRRAIHSSLRAALLIASPILLAQAAPGSQLAAEIESAAASLASEPQLSSWQATHGHDRIDLAHYQTAQDPYELDFARRNQWCATAVPNASPGFTRAATFFVPAVTQGALPPLPPKQDSGLIASCRLSAIWIEARGPSQVAALVAGLATAWGPPTRSSPQQLSRNLTIRGSGFWKDVSLWRRGNVTVWLGWTNWDRGDGVGSRTVVYLQRDRPRDLDLLKAGFNVTSAALKMAGLDPMPTRDIASETSCAKLQAGDAVERLSRWLLAARNLPPVRHAAALLAADAFVPCVLASGAKPASLTRWGLKFRPGCTRDDRVYANTFREQASALDPTGPAGALAALAGLQSPCSLQGAGTWPDLVLDRCKKLPGPFKPGPWSPWIHFALARAHGVKLSFSEPPGEVDAGIVHPLSAAQARQERRAAISEFAQFIAGQPASAESVFAWQQAWRLLAGLPPSPTQFGCGCD